MTLWSILSAVQGNTLYRDHSLFSRYIAQGAVHRRRHAGGVGVPVQQIEGKGSCPSGSY